MARVTDNSWWGCGEWAVGGRRWVFAGERDRSTDVGMDPYLTSPVRTARTVALVACWFIWATVLFLAFTTSIQQVAISVMFLIGFVPYLV